MTRTWSHKHTCQGQLENLMSNQNMIKDEENGSKFRKRCRRRVKMFHRIMQEMLIGSSRNLLSTSVNPGRTRISVHTMIIDPGINYLCPRPSVCLAFFSVHTRFPTRVNPGLTRDLDTSCPCVNRPLV